MWSQADLENSKTPLPRFPWSFQDRRPRLRVTYPNITCELGRTTCRRNSETFCAFRHIWRHRGGFLSKAMVWVLGEESFREESCIFGSLANRKILIIQGSLPARSWSQRPVRFLTHSPCLHVTVFYTQRWPCCCCLPHLRIGCSYLFGMQIFNAGLW